MLIRRLGLADQAAENTSEGDSLVHGSAGRSRGEGLEMEGQVVLDGRAGLHGLHLEGGADVGQRRRAEWQGLGMMLLPALVLGAQVESPRVLKVRRQHDRLVPGLAGKLDAKIPRIQSHENKVEVLGGQVLGSEGIEPIDGISEGSRVPNMLPSEGR